MGDDIAKDSSSRAAVYWFHSFKTSEAKMRCKISALLSGLNSLLFRAMRHPSSSFDPPQLW